MGISSSVEHMIWANVIIIKMCSVDLKVYIGSYMNDDFIWNLLNEPLAV